MPGWLKSCAIGCGVFTVVSIMLMIGCGVSFMRPFKDAVGVREELEAEYGTQEDYRPSIDGVIAPDRIEAFLGVREALRGECEVIGEIFGYFEKMEEMDETSSGGEKVSMVLGAARHVFQMPRAIGGYAGVRNTALLEQGMGLGEYTFIYVLSYYSMLQKDVIAEDLKINDENTSDRVRRTLREMLRHQLEDLRAAGSDPDFEITLRDEIIRLDENDNALPWQNGLPPATLASIEPFRTRIDTLWCAPASPFALSINRQGNKGFSITSD